MTLTEHILILAARPVLRRTIMNQTILAGHQALDVTHQLAIMLEQGLLESIDVGTDHQRRPRPLQYVATPHASSRASSAGAVALL